LVELAVISCDVRVLRQELVCLEKQAREIDVMMIVEILQIGFADLLFQRSKFLEDGMVREVIQLLSEVVNRTLHPTDRIPVTLLKPVNASLLLEK
jgi:hypothetical protein